MKKLFLLTLTVLCSLFFAATVSAAPLKIYIAKVSVSGAPNREEMQANLQMLLSSRLDGDVATPVNTPGEADAVLSIGYIVFGKVFSLEAVAKSPSGVALSRVFIQGDSQDELIPAVTRLADRLKADLSKGNAMPAASQPAVAPVAAEAPAPGIVKIAEKTKESGDTWRSQPLAGVMNLLASGAAGKDGNRDLFIADNRHLFHYRLGSELVPVAEKELKVFEKIIAMDVLDAGEGVDLYLTVLANEQLSSQIWQVKDGKLQQTASGLPYFFRVMALPGKPRQLYIQKSGSARVFAGEIHRAERKGAEIQVGETVSLPAGANIYSFSQFVTKNGKLQTVVITADGQLAVYDQQQREIWRSTEKYGGSELYMERQESNQSGAGDQGTPKVFMNQRIQTTAAGEILVGKNDAFFLIGKNWNLSNGAVFSLSWNGESLEPKWRTRATDYYMPDYCFDEARKELLLLQVTSRPFLLVKGATVLTVRKVE